jgi:SAM-dependent methyltransferase
LADKIYLRKDGLEVLELMCGYGEVSYIMERQLAVSIRYEGIDSSETLIGIAKRLNPSINVIKMDIGEFTPSRKYDLIVIYGGLHHVPDDVNRVFEKICGSLKQEGYFINFEPTYNSPISKKVREYIYLHNALFDSETERPFELSALNRLYASHNFKIVDQIYPGLVSYILYGNPEAFPILKNVGGLGTAKVLFNLDRFFFRNFIGRKLSFATMTLLKKA